MLRICDRISLDHESLEARAGIKCMAGRGDREAVADTVLKAVICTLDPADFFGVALVLDRPVDPVEDRFDLLLLAHVVVNDLIEDLIAQFPDVFFGIRTINDRDRDLDGGRVSGLISCRIGDFIGSFRIVIHGRVIDSVSNVRICVVRDADMILIRDRLAGDHADILRAGNDRWFFIGDQIDM